MGRGGGPGKAAVAALEDLLKIRNTELSLAHLKQGADEITHHMAEKAVTTKEKGIVAGIGERIGTNATGPVEGAHRPPAGQARGIARAAALEATKIVGSFQEREALLDGRDIERPDHVDAVEPLGWQLHRPGEEVIAIGLGNGGKATVEIRGSQLAVEDPDIPG